MDKNLTQTKYDKQSDIYWIIFKPGPTEYSKEVSPGITIEYDQNDEPMGIEIMNFTQYLSQDKIAFTPDQPPIPAH